MKIFRTQFSPKAAFSGFLLVLLVASIGIGVYYANQQSGFELRKKAAEVQGSQLLFKGPQKVNVGEKFTVDLVLDTSTDSQYAISGVDAVFSYDVTSPPLVVPLSVTPGKIFDSYPTVSYNNPLTISGVKNYSVNDKGYFNGFTGQGIFATATFVAQNPGKVTIGLVYKGSFITDDTNINGFLANQPVSLQKPQERLLTAPQALAIEVVASQPTPTPTINECVGKPDGSTCVSGVDCPVCPPGSTTCMKRPCTEQRGMCRNQKCEPLVSPTPPQVGKLSFTLSDTNGAPVWQTVKIFARLADQVGVPTNVKEAPTYAVEFSDLVVSNTPSPQAPPPNPPSRDELVLLGETQTNVSGVGDIFIKNEYLSKPWALYAQTPSHLIRYMQVNIFPIWFSPGKIVDVKFDKLIAGDIYVASGQDRQDGVINNFDVADLFRQWGPYVQIQIVSPKLPVSADFNSDGTINNRDLAVLLSNFGKRGDDLAPGTSTGKEGSFAGILRAVGPNIYQWGTHTLIIKDGTVYQVRAISGAKELLTRYEGLKAVVSGTLEYIQLERSFWGLTAKSVVFDGGPGIKTPPPTQGNECKEASDCGKPQVCKDGKEYPSWSCNEGRCGSINYFKDPCQL